MDEWIGGWCERRRQPSIHPLIHQFSHPPLGPGRMIIDLQRFVAAEQPHWTQLERLLDRLEAEPTARLSLEQLTQFHQLY